jgi:hypothetical protein
MICFKIQIYTNKSVNGTTKIVNEMLKVTFHE